MKAIGHRVWAIPGGHIPLNTTGPEPANTSRDTLCILNTSDQQAHIALTLYYSDHDPIGPYPIEVAAKRVRQIRVNDLIDPQAMPLDTDYAAVIESNVPVVIQFNRVDTSQAENAILSVMAFAVE